MIRVTKRDALRRAFWLAIGAAAITCAGLPEPAAAQRSIELGILGHSIFAPTAAQKDVADVYKEAWGKLEADKPSVRIRLEFHSGSTLANRGLVTIRSRLDVGVK
jgi:hypothetical protein